MGLYFTTQSYLPSLVDWFVKGILFVCGCVFSKISIPLIPDKSEILHSCYVLKFSRDKFCLFFVLGGWNEIQ